MRIDNSKMISALIAGIKKRFANVSTLTLANATYTPAALMSLLQSCIDTAAAIAPLRASFRQAVKVARDTASSARPIIRALKEYVRAVFAGNVEALGDFGMPASPPRKPTVKTKAQAIAKTSATRAARHTMGTRQRKDVKGTAPATPAPASTNAKA